MKKSIPVVYSNDWGDLACGRGHPRGDLTFGRGRPMGDSAIVNLDPRSSGGSHWIAMVATVKDIIVYDSFGRDVLADQLPSVRYTEDDAEQNPFNENNCGQRSLAFLCVYYKHGLGDAMQI